jgi:hypothetical protein
MGNLKDKEPLKDPGVGGRILLKWILKKLIQTVYTEFISLTIETNGGFL